MTNTNLAVTDPRAKRWGSIAKWLFLIFGFAVMAPFIWLAVGGLVGFIERTAGKPSRLGLG